MGTTFDIYLPQTDVIANQPPECHTVSGLRGGPETVLLVEDEPSVRRLVAEVLHQQGYTVLEAANGEQALRVVGQHDTDSVQLLLTDLVMPQMGGRELAERLMGLAPEIKVLLMSGYPDDATLQQNASDATTPFLTKPFTPTVVAQKVREVLDTARESR